MPDRGRTAMVPPTRLAPIDQVPAMLCSPCVPVRPLRWSLMEPRPDRHPARIRPAARRDVEADLDAALEALSHAGWDDPEAATASSEHDVQRLVRVAADLRWAVAALPSPQAVARHQAVIAHVAEGLRARRRWTLRAP